MSAVSTVYDAWLTLIDTTLPDYARIANGLDPSDTPSVILRKGYAFIPTIGENTERQISCKRSFKRDFDIVLVNQVTATQNNYAAWDTLIKNLHEDIASMFAAVEKSTILNNISDGLGQSKVLGDSGIDFVDAGATSKYFQITMSVETEYFEEL